MESKSRDLAVLVAYERVRSRVPGLHVSTHPFRRKLRDPISHDVLDMLAGDDEDSLAVEVRKLASEIAAAVRTLALGGRSYHVREQDSWHGRRASWWLIDVCTPDGETHPYVDPSTDQMKRFRSQGAALKFAAKLARENES